MKNFLYSLLGITIIGYLLYVIIQVIQIALVEDASWQPIRGHLLVVVVFIFVMLRGYFWGNKDEKKEITAAKSPTISSPDDTAESSTTPAYNQYVDKLHFGVYSQSFESWWFDNDGDKHYHSTIYANLRFYEDGTVIGIRTSEIPKIDVPNSFTMKGHWKLVENNLSFHLDKVVDVDDSIEIYISDADQREMKYYGEIADDNSLIKAGNYKGTIRADTLMIEDFLFSKLPESRLIVTSSEPNCDQLETRVKNHPNIIDTSQNTGNWYINGETGPEWFTVHIRTDQNRTKEVEEFVNQELINMGEGGNNMFWG